jgi:glycosyltransferase involved in cell wall biosynthesis
MEGEPAPKLSVVLPAFDERENLVELLPELVDVLTTTGFDHEVIVVDDGSTDGTRRAVRDLELPGVRCIRLRSNSGKSAALSLGIMQTTGDVVVLMDADGQDDPADLPNLLTHLDEGTGLVTGQRCVRNDRFVKRHTSRLYNTATRMVTGIEGRDFNSGFKVMHGELARSIELYGELHRYIPVLATWKGYGVTEIPVQNRRRLHGSSKFGARRFWRGFLDLITVKFLTQYTSRPFHLFGAIGSVLLGLGCLLLGWMALSKLLGHAIGNRPALLIGVLFAVVGIQIITLGLLAELMVNLRRRTNLDAAVDLD